MRYVAVLVALLLLLAGCGKSTQPLHVPASGVVLQVHTGGGQHGSLTFLPDYVPLFTLWGDGRVVFLAADQSIRTARFTPDAVRRLVQAAAFLYDLQDHYRATDGTDQADTHFVLNTDRGRKLAAVYGLDLRAAGNEEQDRAVMDRLRTLYRTLQDALPLNAPLLQPDEVTVHHDPARPAEVATRVWPLELTGRLIGAQAREAVRMAGLGQPGLFRLDGQAEQVLVVPALPQTWGPAPAPSGPAAQPVPTVQRLGGTADDGTLAVETLLTYEEAADQWLWLANLHNRSATAIDVLYDCGLLATLAGGRVPPVDRVCPGVASRQVAPGETVRVEARLAPTELAADAAKLVVVVRWQGTAPVLAHRVQATLKPQPLGGP